MEFDQDNVRQVVEEDRLSSLPDELLHKILSSFDMKLVVQMCVLSSRWKLLWTSMTCLNFSSGKYDILRFSKFVNHVLSYRNHQIQVSSIKLEFVGAANQALMRKIANYAFSHNVQKLDVLNISFSYSAVSFPPCLFSSQSLIHFSLGVEYKYMDFPALTTMHLSKIRLCGDLFSKCVNLKNLTLQDFCIENTEVLDIITPRLSNLILINSEYVKVINLVAPLLENLTVIDCKTIEYLNAPAGLVSLCCQGYPPPPLEFFKNGFRSINKLTLCLKMSSPYEEEDARLAINILQELHSTRHLTLGADVIERMEFGHDNVRQAVEEDRLSSLPDELLHKILFSFDMTFAVQTSVLSSRWGFLWTTMPSFNLSSQNFDENLHKFTKFVTKVVSHRNHEIEVSSVKLYLDRAPRQIFLKKIAEYIFSHNVQELTIRIRPIKHLKLPPCLFSSQSLKHLTLSNHGYGYSPCVTPKTPWDFPALTTLHLRDITFSDDDTGNSVDIFSKCVNLRNLTLEGFFMEGVEVLDILTPRLSNLRLNNCQVKVINLVASQLENLTVIDCQTIEYLNAPPGLVSLCCKDFSLPMQLSKEGFHSLNKVTLCLDRYGFFDKEENAPKIIKMLQEIHSARDLTLSADIIECLSSFPDLLYPHPSPFSNLISLTIIDYSYSKDTYKVKMSTETKNFLLENSPNAKLILELPKDPSRR